MMFPIFSTLVLCAIVQLGTGSSIKASNHSISQAQTACACIEDVLGSGIVQFPGDPEYQAGATSAWNILNSYERPTCVVFPRETVHVQEAMKAIYENEARYAVQAGSRGGIEGWSNVQSGVLIHFSHMKNVSYDAVKDVITLEPGVHYGDVMSILESDGVAPVGGRVKNVGTGLLLGGGLSFLSPFHGFAADSFIELDVVLVTGEMVTATAHNQYNDLFRALKGGANRFGIVTRYVMDAIHTGTKEDKTWFGGSITYPDSSSEALLNAVARYVRTVDDPKAAMLIAVVNILIEGSYVPVRDVTLFYNGSELPIDVFGEFLSIPSISRNLRPLSYYDVVDFMGDVQPDLIQLFAATALIGEETLFMNAFNQWQNFTQSFQSNFLMSLLAITPIPHSQIEAGRVRGGNAINAPNGPYATIAIQQTFLPNMTHVSSAVEEGRQHLLRQIPASPGKPLSITECDGKQNIFASYGDYAFLKKTYAKYDPTRFNVRHTDGPIGL